MTENADLIIVGGGVIGLSCAWRLAAEGLRVRLYERARCGSGASEAALGVLAPPSPIPQQPLQLNHRRSLALFPDFAAALHAASGIDPVYARCGSLEIIPGESQQAMAQREAGFFAANGVVLPDLPELRLISKADVQAMEPGIRASDFGALWCPAAAKISVDAFLRALAGACRNQGVEICEGRAVDGIETRAGVVRGVRIAGELVSCERVMVAAGVWTPALMPALADYAPIRPVRGQALLLRATPPPVSHIVKWQRGYIVPWTADTAAVGSTTDRRSGLDQSVTAGGLHEVMGKALAIAPALAAAGVLKTWAGLRPAPLDQRPIMGPIPGVEGLFAAAGHYKIGFGFAPRCAELMAAMIAHAQTPEGAAAFLPRRTQSA